MNITFTKVSRYKDRSQKRIVNKKVKSRKERKANSISLRQIPNFTDTQNKLPMKRIKTFIALALLMGAVMTACSSQQKSCAAYSSVEYQNPADNS